MPWFKVDDGFPFHPKALSAGNAACGLWVRAGAWSMQQMTDGFVPEHVLRTLGTKNEAQRLVEAGLWERTDSGWTFHDFAEFQPSREQVEADRTAAAERQRKSRERRQQGGDSE